MVAPLAFASSLKSRRCVADEQQQYAPPCAYSTAGPTATAAAADEDDAAKPAPHSAASPRTIGVYTSPSTAAVPPAPAGTSSTAVRSSTPCGSAIFGMAWSVTIRTMWTFRGTAHAPAFSALTAAQKRSDQVGWRTSAALLPSSARFGPDTIQDAVSCATLDAAETALTAAGRLSTVLADSLASVPSYHPSPVYTKRP